MVTNKFAQVEPNTLSPNRHWPRSLRIDPCFATHDDLEWLLESSGDVVLSAILVRQFGEGSESFGHLNERVNGDYKSSDFVRQGAGYHWTTLRQEEAEQLAREDRGLKVPNPGIPTAYIRDDIGWVVASLAGRLRSPEHECHSGLAFDFGQLASVTVALSHLPLGGTSKDPGNGRLRSL